MSATSACPQQYWPRATVGPTGIGLLSYWFGWLQTTQTLLQSQKSHSSIYLNNWPAAAWWASFRCGVMAIPDCSSTCKICNFIYTCPGQIGPGLTPWPTGERKIWAVGKCVGKIFIGNTTEIFPTRWASLPPKYSSPQFFWTTPRYGMAPPSPYDGHMLGSSCASTAHVTDAPWPRRTPLPPHT